MSGPTINRVIWGIIIPTNAKMPHTATEIEVINVAKIKNINLFNSTFSPNVLAESSDRDNIFILLEKIKKKGSKNNIIGAAIYTCSHLESWNPPASQFNIAFNSPNFFEETRTKDIIELRKAETARPESIKDVPEEFVVILDNKNTANAAISPPKNEKVGRTNNDELAIPKDIVITAPAAAPEETPIMPGSAIGFLNIPCKEAPETASAEPTSIDNIILGILILEITLSFTGSIFEESIKYPNIYLKESKKVVDTAPLDKEITTKINPVTINNGTININFW